MKHPWLAYLIVSLLAIGVGVAVAGLPNDEPTAATITDGTIVVTPATDASATSVPEPPSTESSSTSEPTTSEAPTTTVAASTTTTPPTTTPPTNTEPPLPDRADIVVIAANGSGRSGVAAANAAELETLGYTNVRPRNGTDVVDLTAIYYADGFEQSAVRMATDFGLFPEFVSPLDEGPQVLDLPADAQLVVYLGIDRA